MNTVKNEDWLAPTEIRLPNFIICGAMKSGTSTVHQILNQHPRISIPDKEIHFFDSDNLSRAPRLLHLPAGEMALSRHP